jgi:hydrogenase maturation protease
MSGISKSKALWNNHPRMLVLGLGDFIFRDDGVGVHAVRRFQELKPRPCLAVEVGTSILDTVRMLESADRIIVFDSIQAGGQPGSVYVLHAADMIRRDRYEILRDMRLFGILPTLLHPPSEVIIIGAEPQIVDWGTELTPALDFAASIMVSTAQKVISEWNSLDVGHGHVDLASIVRDSSLEIQQFH